MQNKGSCLCGGIAFETEGKLRGVIFCHCSQCRKTHGHIAAYTACEKTSFKLTHQETLKWYQSSEVVRRGFCSSCGGSLFFDTEATPELIYISAGTLDIPTGIRPLKEIYTRSASDYY